jgi:hypothetical protein
LYICVYLNIIFVISKCTILVHVYEEDKNSCRGPFFTEYMQIINIMSHEQSFSYVEWFKFVVGMRSQWRHNVDQNFVQGWKRLYKLLEIDLYYIVSWKASKHCDLLAVVLSHRLVPASVWTTLSNHGCIESPKLPLNTEKVTEITDEITETTSVYVRLYVSESHTKFHKDWFSFEKVIAINTPGNLEGLNRMLRRGKTCGRFRLRVAGGFLQGIGLL